FFTPNFFGVFGLTSLDNQDLLHSSRLLLTAMARSENTGTAYNSLRTFLRSSGKGPILLEPISGEAVLNLGDRGIPKVFFLDALGRRAGEIPVRPKEKTAVIPLEAAGAYEIIWEKA
ncbi:MAG TPA: hypothetical protein VJC08_01665, partial [bacterium]|nr:hypothetical protein [bacterium]